MCLSICVNSLYAQSADGYDRNFKLGFGLSGGVPFNNPYSFNVGGDVRLQYNISKTYSLTLTTGYNNLFVKDDGVNFGYVPVKVGYKTFLFSNEFYVMAEMGGAFSTTKDYNNNSLMFGPSIGYATKYVDISLRYEFLKDFPVIKDNTVDDGLGQIMLRLAYGFDI
jgi:hypothetical protein